MEARSGVYCITDTVENKYYVGSAVDFDRREYHHFRLLRLGRHTNWRLQRAYNKGHELRVTFIPTAPGENPLVLEQALLDKFYDTGCLLNIARDAKAPMLGLKSSEETRRKVGLAHIGRTFSPETIARMRIAAQGRNLGRKLSKEHREKISVAQKGRIQSEATKAGAKAWNEKQKNMSQEDRAAKRLKMADRCTPVSIDGVRYESVKHAAQLLGVSTGMIEHRTRSSAPKYSNWMLL